MYFGIRNLTTRAFCFLKARFLLLFVHSCLRMNKDVNKQSECYLSLHVCDLYFQHLDVLQVNLTLLHLTSSYAECRCLKYMCVLFFSDCVYPTQPILTGFYRNNVQTNIV